MSGTLHIPELPLASGHRSRRDSGRLRWFDRFIGQLPPRTAILAVLLFTVVSALFFGQVVYGLLAGQVPSGVGIVTVVTTLLVATPLIAFSILTIRHLDAARAKAHAMAAALDERNAQLATIRRDLEARAVALEEARAAAESANAAKSEFLANMSHELRTPLNAILGFSEMLIERRALFGASCEKRIDEYSEAIHGSGDLLLSLVNDLLDLARIEAGKYDYAPETCRVRALVEQAVLPLDPRARERGQTLDLHHCACDCTVLADPRALRQVLTNLLSNALKFSPEGSTVTFRARCGPDGVTFSIRDEGIGMTAEEVAMALRPFTRMSQAHIASGDSIGLGLSIVKALVDLHGGTLTLDSEKGVGTTARVTLPAR